MTSEDILRKMPAWLLRSNAKAVMLINFSLLLIVLGLWAFLLTRPLMPPTIDASQVRKNRPVQTLGVLAYLDKLAEMPPVDGEINPLSLMPLQNPDLLSNRKWGRPQTNSTQVITSVKDPPPIPKPKPVNVVFKGLLKRTDGAVMALISDSESGSTAFYQTNTNVCGLAIVSIDADKVQVKDQTGQLVELPFRQTVPFVEGKYVP
jgi:hypothetical protein